jgi:hypothetical protein
MVSIPSPCFLDDCEPLGFIAGERRWRNREGTRLYTWDYRHGEIEVFDRRGRHLGAADAITGVPTKPAVRGRRIDV